MPKITLDIPEDRIPLLFEVTEALGLNKEDIIEIDGIPEWHKQILNERLENYYSGKSTLTKFEEFFDELEKEDE